MANEEEATGMGGRDRGCVEDKKFVDSSPFGCLRINKSDSLAHFKFFLNTCIFLLESTLKQASKREKLGEVGGLTDHPL